MIKVGIWKNENGSLLNLEKIENGILSGSYKTNSPKKTLDRWFSMHGFVNQNLINFVVSWENHRSITSWCGRLVLDEERNLNYIKCFWHLARAYEDESQNRETQLWNTFLTGVDIFKHTGN
jgi:hypothetical protein